MFIEAKAHYKKAIQLSPNLPEAYFNLAIIYFQENDLEQAKKNVEKALELEPELSEHSDIVNQIIQSSAEGE